MSVVQKVLKSDPEIECYSPLHKAYMAIAGVGLVLYTFGYARPNWEPWTSPEQNLCSFPLVAVVALSYIHKKQRHNNPLPLLLFGDLYDRRRPAPRSSFCLSGR